MKTKCFFLSIIISRPPADGFFHSKAAFAPNASLTNDL